MAGSLESPVRRCAYTAGSKKKGHGGMDAPVARKKQPEEALLQPFGRRRVHALR
jgi:hypothetical protein